MDPKLLELLKKSLNVSDKTQEAGDRIPYRDSNTQSMVDAYEMREKALANMAQGVSQQKAVASTFGGRDFFKMLQEEAVMEQQANAALGPYAVAPAYQPGERIPEMSPESKAAAMRMAQKGENGPNPFKPYNWGQSESENPRQGPEYQAMALRDRLIQQLIANTPGRPNIPWRPTPTTDATRFVGS